MDELDRAGAQPHPASPRLPGGRPVAAHPLLGLLLDAADGRYPPDDGTCAVLPPLPGGLACSVAFTGYAAVATDRPAAAVLARHPDGYGGSLAPDFLRWLAGPGGWIGVVDVTLVARGRGVGGPPRRDDLADHPRVRHAAALRDDVRVHGDDRGLLTLATGLAGRREVGVAAAEPGRGTGRALLADALGLVPAGEPLFAAVSPGNARSLRAFLAAGFRPVGSEVLLRPAAVTGR